MFKKSFIEKIEPRSIEFETITLQQLQMMLQYVKGAKIETICTITYPNLKAFNENSCCPYANIVKVSRVNCMINFNYKDAVNKQLDREGKEANFIPYKRKWGTRLTDSPFISHVSKEGAYNLYLEVRILKSLGHSYYDLVFGDLIPEEAIKPWLRDKHDARKFQGTEKEIILRDYLVHNIASIVIDGSGYLIKENIS